MKSILTLGLVMFAMTFCGLGDKLKQMSGGGSNSGTNTATSGANSTSSSGTVEKATLNGPQKAIMDAGVEVKWDEQGMFWKLPAGWSKSAAVSAWREQKVQMPDRLPAVFGLLAT